MKKLSFSLFAPLFLLSLLVPLAASAHLGPGAEMPSIFPTGFWATQADGGFVPCAQADPGEVSQKCTLTELIHSALHVLAFGMTLALFVGAPILFAWGGIMIMIAGGSPEKLGQGKKILTGTLIGVLIILGAHLIIRTFVSLLGIKGIGGFS